MSICRHRRSNSRSPANGPDDALFQIVNDNQLEFIEAPDFEAPTDADGDNTYVVELRVDDGSLSSTTSVVFDVFDEHPIINPGQNFFVSENSATGTIVGTPLATDGDAVTTSQTWSIEGGTGAFDIDSQRVRFSVLDGSQLDREVASGGNSSIFGYVFGDQNQDGLWDTVAEPALADLTVGLLDTEFRLLELVDSDADGRYEFSNLAAGNYLVFPFGGAQPLPVQLADDQAYAVPNIGLADADPSNEAPVLTITDARQEGTTVYVEGFVTDDSSFGSDVQVIIGGAANGQLTPEDDGTFSFVGTVEQSGSLYVFAIDGNNGYSEAQDVLTVDNIATVNLNITIADQGAILESEIVTIVIQDVNEFAPDVTDAVFDVDENSPTGTVIGTLSATDADATNGGFTYSIIAGNDLQIFAIDNDGMLTIDDNIGLDFETTTQVALTVEVSDNGPGAAKTETAIVTINVNPVNDNAPLFGSATAVTVPENTTFVQALLATDADQPSQTVEFSISGGEDAAKFKITGDQLEFVSAPDFENPSDVDNDNVYEVEVVADDGSGMTTTQTVLVTVTGANDPASISGTATGALSEDNATNQTGGTLTVVDPDEGQGVFQSPTSLNGIYGDFAFVAATGTLDVHAGQWPGSHGRTEWGSGCSRQLGCGILGMERL